jgi:hypothetical protein
MCQNHPLYIFERHPRDGHLHSEVLHDTASDPGTILNVA